MYSWFSNFLLFWLFQIFHCCFVFYSIVMLPFCFYIALAQNLWIFKKCFHVKYDLEALIQCFHGFFQTMWDADFPAFPVIFGKGKREKRREKGWNATYIYNNFLIFSWCTVWKIWKLCHLISKSVNIFIVTLNILFDIKHFFCCCCCCCSAR